MIRIMTMTMVYDDNYNSLDICYYFRGTIKKCVVFVYVIIQLSNFYVLRLRLAGTNKTSRRKRKQCFFYKYDKDFFLKCLKRALNKKK